MIRTDWIKEQKEEGYDKDQMVAALEDGAYLKQAGISQEDAEDTHFYLTTNSIQ